jgi:hypothetical protein
MDGKPRGAARARTLWGFTGRKLVLFLGVLATIGLVLVSPTSAAGATEARFTYELCDSALPGGAVPVSEHAYSNAFSPFQNCASPGGAIGLTETESASATFGALYVSIPATPGGFVENETVTAVQSGVEPGNALHYSHIEENGFPGPAAEATRLFQVRTEPAFLGGGGASVEIYMSCDGNVGPCSPGPVEAVRWIAATEVDPTPPTLAHLAGGLLGGGTIRGHQNLEVEAADIGGGVSSIGVLVNGVPVAAPVAGACHLASVSNKSYIGVVALSPSPCPPALKGEWTLDTETAPFHEGINTVQVCAADLGTISNPNQTCSPAQSVDIDDSCTNSTVPGGELLSAQFASTAKETKTAHYGHGAEVVGRLANDADEPIAGATLCVKLQTIGVEPTASPVTSVSTDGAGDYSYRLPPGPNRDVVIGYRHDSHQIARDVRFYSHVEPSLTASAKKLHNGQRVAFTGQLPGPRRRGRVVILQANVKGSRRWITFRRATSAKRGAFQAGYRFHSTTRKTTYRFRAVVPEQAGYPWMQGHSKPVPVLVEP